MTCCMQAADSLGVLQLERQEYREALHSLDTALSIATPLAELPEVRNPSASRRLDTWHGTALYEPSALLSSA